MRLRIVSLFATVAAFTLAITGQSQQKDAAKEVIAKLQGVWQVVKFIESSLREDTPEQIKLKDVTFEFKDNLFIQREGKAGVGPPATYTVDVSKAPKWISVKFFEEVDEGIFKLEGDELTLCFRSGARGAKPSQRPTEFKASKDPPNSLLVLKGVKTPAPQKDPNKEDMKALQGVWQVVRMTEDDARKDSPDEYKGSSYEFKDNKVILKLEGGEAPPCAYSLDATKTPKWINIEMGKVLEGVYKLNGDDLSICIVSGQKDDEPTPRPTEFKTRKDSFHTIIDLKRKTK